MEEESIDKRIMKKGFTGKRNLRKINHNKWFIEKKYGNESCKKGVKEREKRIGMDNN